MKQHIKLIGLLYILIIGIVACNSQNVFEQYATIENKQWLYTQTIPFQVEITDTSSQYKIQVNIRHTNEYPYRNLWIYMYTTYPSGEKLKQRVDLPLADKKGKWYGSGIGDIINTQVLIQQHAKMPEKGTYTFELEQNMRLNPLGEIMDIGISIDKMPK